MAARIPRRGFAPSLVITLASAAGLSACGAPAAKPTQVMTNPPAPLVRSIWEVRTDGPDHCVAAPCPDGIYDCKQELATPYPCVPGHATVLIYRQPGETACMYNDEPEPPDCPPTSSCNPPPVQSNPAPTPCPDGL